MARLPQWATPERQRYLVELFGEAGNLCLYGHPAVECFDQSHYTYAERKRRWSGSRPIPVLIGQTGGEGMLGRSRTAVFETVIRTDQTLYDKTVREQVAFWVAEDRNRRVFEARVEDAIFRRTGEVGRFTGVLDTRPHRQGFDPIQRENYFYDSTPDDRAHQPAYFLEGFGFNPLTHHRVALIRIPSTTVKLFVDLGGIVKGRNARKKAFKYADSPPAELMALVRERCSRVARAYWKRQPKMA